MYLALPRRCLRKNSFFHGLSLLILTKYRSKISVCFSSAMTWDSGSRNWALQWCPVQGHINRGWVKWAQVWHFEPESWTFYFIWVCCRAKSKTRPSSLEHYLLMKQNESLHCQYLVMDSRIIWVFSFSIHIKVIGAKNIFIISDGRVSNGVWFSYIFISGKESGKELGVFCSFLAKEDKGQ